jgi:hypothetical protein
VNIMGVTAVVAAAAPTTGLSTDVAAGSTSIMVMAEATITTSTTAPVAAATPVDMSTRLPVNAERAIRGMAEGKASTGASGVAKNASPN